MSTLAWWLLFTWFVSLGISLFEYVPYMGKGKQRKPLSGTDVNVLVVITLIIMALLINALGWV